MGGVTRHRRFVPSDKVGSLVGQGSGKDQPYFLTYII